jgi:hypothetical protein
MPLARFPFYGAFYNRLNRQGHTLSLGFGTHAKEVARRPDELGINFEITTAGGVFIPGGAGNIMDIFAI